MNKKLDDARMNVGGAVTVLLGVASLLLLLLVWGWIFLFTPPAVEMGVLQKIMYVHVPSIYTAYLAFTVVFVSSIVYLWQDSERADSLAKSSAEVGVLFCFLGLASGAIWGRSTWGVYWVWDARLTTTLVLLLIYCSYVLLRLAGENSDVRSRLAAIIGIVGFLNIPLVHISVSWWRTLHQPSSLFKIGSGGPRIAMSPSLLWPLLASMFVFTIWYLFLLRLRLQVLREQEILDEQTLEV